MLHDANKGYKSVIKGKRNLEHSKYLNVVKYSGTCVIRILMAQNNHINHIKIWFHSFNTLVNRTSVVRKKIKKFEQFMSNSSI